MTSHPPPRRAAFVARAAAVLVLWVYAYYAYEWLFFVTKGSIVSSSDWSVRILMLLVPPLVPLAALIPLQLFLSFVDALRASAVRWFAAFLPAGVATLLLFIALENFGRTVFGRGVSDVEGGGRWALFIAAALLWFVLLRLIGVRLARTRTDNRRAMAAAGTLLACGLVALPLTLDSSARVDDRTPSQTVRSGQRPNVLLLGIDGVSARRMSVYGYPRRTTGNLEALASRATLFENAFSNVGITCGSLISLITGKRPTESHVYQCPVFLEGNLSTQHLPGILRAAGYTNAQIGLRDHADAEDWNMRGAFHEINGRVARNATPGESRSSTSDRVRRFATEVEQRITDRVLHLAGVRPMEDTYRFLAGASSNASFSDQARVRLAEDFIGSRREPWFLHMHLLDTHCCDWGFAPYRFSRPSAFHDARWRADRSDDALWQIDRYVARLIDALRATGQLDRTMIVLYSDHSMGWTTIERVPLIVILPGQRTGRRVSANVELIDVAPTILAEIGLDPPAWMAGRSLMDSHSLDASHPIFGLWEGAEAGKPALIPRPPFNGARTATVVLCNQWVEVLLDGGKIEKQGTVEGHTAPCGDDLHERAYSLLTSHLAASGYPSTRAPGDVPTASHEDRRTQ